MRSAFPHVARDPSEATNTQLVASTSALDDLDAERLPAALKPIARDAAERLEPGLHGGTVYTDDKAPVEWLVDKSILDYADED